MSVETSYFIVDWAMLQDLPTDTDLGEHFILAPNSGDEEEDADNFDADGFEDEDEDEDDDDDDGYNDRHAEGARLLDFGDHNAVFESWNVFMEVSDWLRPLRGKLDPSIERPFTALFTAIGILLDDSSAPAAIKQGARFTDDALIASISPAEVKKLGNAASALDRRVLEREFGRVLAEHPCDYLPNGKAVVAWVEALDRALSSVRKHEGILILAPV